MRRRPGLSLKLGALLTLGVVGAMLAYAWLAGGGRAGALLFVGVATAAAMIFAIALDVLVTRPLVLLATQVRRMDEVGLDAPFQPTGIDEPRELGEALERLRRSLVAEREQLRGLNDALEQRVAERSRALEQAGEALRRSEKLASVGRLAAGVAHEVNNPAAVILARAALLADQELPAEVIEDLRVIERQAARIRDITAGLLRLGRPSAGTREPVDLADVARNAVALVRVEATKKSVRVDLAAAEALVIADPGGLEQVAYNVVRNAVQASPPGGRVRVSAGPGGLVVEDEGPGVAPEHRASLFEPFFTTKPAGEGTGLGLAIAHGIVAEHGGTIEVEGLDPTGARFVVRLPAAPAR